MTIQEKIIPFTRELLGGLSEAELPDEKIISFLNDAWNEFQISLAKAREDFFVETKVLSNLLKNESMYTFPEDMLLLKRIEINYEDSSREDLYKRAKEVDVANIEGDKSWEWYVKNQPKDNPLYDHRGDYFEIAPVPDKDVENGIRIYYLAKRKIIGSDNNEKIEFTEGTDLIPYPLTSYPELICYKIASDYLRTIGATSFQIMEANNLLSIYEKKLKTLIEGMQPREQNVYFTKGINLTGYEF